MMNRRQFVQSAALAGASLIVLGRDAWALGAAEPVNRRLIVVFMRGAVDGLNVVVPYREANYYRLRSRIAIAKPGEADGALDLDGRFALHPALAPVMPLWRQGSLAFVHASGSPDPTRSHFDAQDNIETGTPGKRLTADGWLNRLEGVLPADPATGDAAVRSVSVGTLVPRIFQGRNKVATVPSGATARQASVLDRPKIEAAFAAVYRHDSKLGAVFKDYEVARDDVSAALQDADTAEMRAAANGAPPTHAFAGDASRLGTLMQRDPRVQLGFLAVSGWDTHAAQGGTKGTLAYRLGLFAKGLDALHQNLGPVYADTAIVVVSEFGRTAAENGNGGTDHGHGNVMWLMGGRIAGGKIHGAWPGLDDSALHQQRDLAITTDFRTVLAQICERHLRLPDARLDAVFPAMPKATGSLSVVKA
jgi:uncharacterized protein (DUF1501 family)